MPNIIRIQDLTAAEISQLLRAGGSDLTEREAATIKDFVEDVGGVKTALAAVEVLGKLKKAA